MSRLVDSLGEEIRSNADVLGYTPAASASGPAVAATALTWTVLPLTTIALDNDSIIHSNRVQPTRAGRYRIVATVQIPVTATAVTEYGAGLRRNGGTVDATQFTNAGYTSTNPRNITTAGDYDFNGTTDYVEVMGLVNGAANILPYKVDVSYLGGNILTPVRFKPLTWQATAAGGSLSAVFPTGPFARYDTLEYAVPDPMGGYVLQEFVYRDDLDGTKPWHYKGGAPLISEVNTAEVVNSVTYVALTTAGPSITVPRLGDYDVEIHGHYGGIGWMSYSVGGAAASDTDSLHTGSSAGLGASSMSFRRKIGLAASTALVAMYRNDSGQGSFNWSNRRMQVTPVRMA